MKFVMNRDFLLQGFGHAIRFEENVPMNVPPKLRAEARRYGAKEILDEGEESTLELSEAEKKANVPFKRTAEEPQGEDRTRLLVEACDYLVGENNNKKFGANGAPSIGAIKDLVGFRIDATERNHIWETYNREKYAKLHPSNTNESASEVDLTVAETNTG
jgi:hypothetical protein